MRLPEEPPAKPDEERKVLDYQTRDEASAARSRAAIAIILGFVLSAALVGVVGFVVFVPIGLNHASSPMGPRTRHWTPVVLFFAVSLIAFVFGPIVMRKRFASRFFFLGLLLGTAWICLIEGVCFLGTP